MTKQTAGLIGVFFLLVDIASKSLVYHLLPPVSLFPFFPYGGIPIWKGVLGTSFCLVHAKNLGAAWGLFDQVPNFLFGVRLFVWLALFFWIAFWNRDQRKVFPFTLVLFGALGNLLDKFFYGAVIDFFYFQFFGYSYPVFNVADSMIVVGVLWLLVEPKVRRRVTGSS